MKAEISLRALCCSSAAHADAYEQAAAGAEVLRHHWYLLFGHQHSSFQSRCTLCVKKAAERALWHGLPTGMYWCKPERSCLVLKPGMTNFLPQPNKVWSPVALYSIPELSNFQQIYQKSQLPLTKGKIQQGFGFSPHLFRRTALELFNLKFP